MLLDLRSLWNRATTGGVGLGRGAGSTIYYGNQVAAAADQALQIDLGDIDVASVLDVVAGILLVAVEAAASADVATQLSLLTPDEQATIAEGAPTVGLAVLDAVVVNDLASLISLLTPNDAAAVTEAISLIAVSGASDSAVLSDGTLFDGLATAADNALATDAVLSVLAVAVDVDVASALEAVGGIALSGANEPVSASDLPVLIGLAALDAVAAVDAVASVVAATSGQDASTVSDAVGTLALSGIGDPASASEIAVSITLNSADSVLAADIVSDLTEITFITASDSANAADGGEQVFQFTPVASDFDLSGRTEEGAELVYVYPWRKPKRKSEVTSVPVIPGEERVAAEVVGAMLAMYHAGVIDYDELEVLVAAA